MQHQVVFEEYGIIDVDNDSQFLLLSNLDLENKLCCSILTSKSFDGRLLRLYAPRVVKRKTMTRSQRLEQVKAIANAKSPDQLFHGTGGNHLNSDDYFKS